MLTKIKQELNKDLVIRLSLSDWSISATLGIIMSPELELVVINKIDELSVLEMSLLNFMCKPILVTSRSIDSYNVVKTKIIDYVDFNCDLRNPENSFINWYRKWERQ
jgi:hypothetical protein